MSRAMSSSAENVIARTDSLGSDDARASNRPGADLRRADMSDADLSDGRLDGADVRDVNFSGADLDDVVGVPSRTSGSQYSDTTCPDGTLQSSTCWP